MRHSATILITPSVPDGLFNKGCRERNPRSQVYNSHACGKQMQ